MKSTDFYIRGIDPSVKAKLEASAKQKGISLNALIKVVLSDYAMLPDIRYINDKYENLFKDMTAMYNHRLEKNEEVLSENIELLNTLLEMLGS